MEGLVVLRESKCRLASKRPLNPIKQYVSNLTQAATMTVVSEPDYGSERKKV
jgi:hypothetical protein